MKIKKELELAEYIILVNNMVQEYFDENNNYTPHWGRLNAMRLFYNHCVQEDIAGLSHDISDASQMTALVKNDEFMKDFENCTYCYDAKLTFANAYAMADKMVNVKTHSFNYAVDSLKIVANNFLKGIIDSLSQENIDKIEKIANQISNGELSAEAISEAVGNSEIFKKLIGEKKDDAT